METIYEQSIDLSSVSCCLWRQSWNKRERKANSKNSAAPHDEALQFGMVTQEDFLRTGDAVALTRKGRSSLTGV